MYINYLEENRYLIVGGGVFQCFNLHIFLNPELNEWISFLHFVFVQIKQTRS